MEFSGQAMNAAMWTLSGKRALVTGASGGLGAHFAKVLAIAGAEVLLAARREAALDTVARDIKSTGGQCTTVKLDVADSSSIRALSNKIEQLDILVNSAGITREGAVLDQSEADWDDVINTNLKGMFLMAQTVAKTMRDNK
jgi:NAD(P)-dependent dehydrogenase (short-subunit alcohol dehydrogenase family)